MSRLARPVRGVAPGQTLALYAGTRVVGSATIRAALRSTSTGSIPADRWRRPGLVAGVDGSWV